MNQLQIAFDIITDSAIRYTGASMFDAPSEGYYALTNAAHDILSVAAIDALAGIYRATDAAMEEKAYLDSLYSHVQPSAAQPAAQIPLSANGLPFHEDQLVYSDFDDDYGTVQFIHDDHLILALPYDGGYPGQQFSGTRQFGDVFVVYDQPQPAAQVQRTLLTDNKGVVGVIDVDQPAPVPSAVQPKLSAGEIKALTFLRQIEDRSHKDISVSLSNKTGYGTYGALIHRGSAEKLLKRGYVLIHFDLVHLTDAGRAALKR